MGKLINVFANVPKKNIKNQIKNNENLKIENKIIAIPTTSGAGSESTHFSVIYFDKKKYSYAQKNLLPSFSIVDPKFTLNTPKNIYGISFADSFSQLLESVWSVNSNNESLEFSFEGLKLILNNYKNAFLIKDDIKSKINLSKAAMLSGQAINISKTTAPHAVSYAFTSNYSIPHGNAVALTLSFFAGFNYNVTDNDCLELRGKDYVREKFKKLFKLFNCKGINEFCKKIDLIFSVAGINLSLKKYNINQNEMFDKIISSINEERLNNNPRKLDKKLLFNYLIKL